jgi:hypothetical protein
MATEHQTLANHASAAEGKRRVALLFPVTSPPTRGMAIFKSNPILTEFRPHFLQGSDSHRTSFDHPPEVKRFSKASKTKPIWPSANARAKSAQDAAASSLLAPDTVAAFRCAHLLESAWDSLAGDRSRFELELFRRRATAGTRLKPAKPPGERISNRSPRKRFLA